MKSKLYTLVFLLLLAQFAPAQNSDAKRTNHWYFGANAGLDFSSGTPVADTLGQINVLEGCAVLSDTSGKLLFYTDSKKVWNRNHQIMQNGDSLGVPFTTPRDAAVIIPKPGSDSIYYLFNVDGWENQFQRGLRWHEIDMQLANGLGAVTLKDNLLYAPVTEQIAATRHSNGCDYWVVTHERNSDKFLAFKVTSNGVDSMPVISAAGENYAVAQQSYILNGGYHLNFSPNGKMAISDVEMNYTVTHLPIPNKLQLLHFDQSEGTFSYFLDFPIDTTHRHGFFSPDNSKLYYETGYYPPSRFYQFDLSSGFDSIILQTMVLVAGGYRHSFVQSAQIGRDGKIYLASEGDTSGQIGSPNFLSVIANPNALGTACNLQIAGQPLGSGRARTGMPNFVSNFTGNILSAPCQYTVIYETGSEQWDNILVYPNAADDRITVSGNYFKAGTKLSIVDVAGRLWLERRISYAENEIVLEVSHIPIGVYLLHLQTKNLHKTFRIFIHH